MRIPSLVLVVLLLSGCAVGGAVRGGMASYDPALPSPTSARLAGLPLRAVEVRSPSWLATPAMQYRLAYHDAARREAYAESRWVAPPAELLELALKRRMLVDAAQSQAVGCRLQVELGEFAQVFDTPQASRAVLEVRATLLAPRGDLLLARRSFSRSQPAGADARTGAAAFGLALSGLADDVDAWLAKVAREHPDAALRCHGG